MPPRKLTGYPPPDRDADRFQRCFDQSGPKPADPFTCTAACSRCATGLLTVVVLVSIGPWATPHAAHASDRGDP